MELFFITVWITCCVASSQADNKTIVTRDKKIFPLLFFPATRRTVAPSACTTATGLDGTCYSNSRCIALGLTISGSCSSVTGVCCTDNKTCGGSSASSIIYFSNPPTLPPRCTLKITKANSTITQLRLDFIKFTLNAPQMGKCTNYLQLSPTDSSLPKICGENSGSHVYIDFDPLCNDHTLQFTFGNQASPDQWNIKITQIPSTSNVRAPRGCLMYYPNSISGTVTSFNYGTTIDTDTRLLSPLNYGICIAPQTGYCSIQYALGEFSMSTNAVCDHNYVVIAGSTPESPAVSTYSDRYCSSDFPNPTTSLKPYVLYVATNVDDTDVGTTGFRLNYQQLAC